MKAYPHPPHRSIDFGKLVGDTWRLVWRHKFLWFFGLFAGSGNFFSGGGDFNFDTGTDNAPSRGSQLNRTDDTGREVLDWINAHLTLVIVLAVAAVAILVLIWLWSILCRGAVIGSVRDVRRDKPIDFKSAFSRGRESFGRLLLFDLFLLLLIVCLFVIIAAIVLFIVFMAMAAGEAGSIVLSIIGLWLLAFLVFGLGCLACCTIWFVPWIFFGIILNYSTRAVVLEEMRPMAAFRRAWKVMIGNLGQTMLVFLVNVGLNIGAGIAVLIAVGLGSVPSIIAWIFAYNQHWPFSLIAIASGLTVIPLTMILLAAAATNTYFSAYWTIAFEKLAGNEPSDGPGQIPTYKH